MSYTFLSTLLVVAVIACIIGCRIAKPIRRLYYAGKSVFRGKYFHEHYTEVGGKQVIVYRTVFGNWFWELMGKLYSFVIVFVLLFVFMVRFHGTEGYALAGDYSKGDTVMVFCYDNWFHAEIGTLISSGENITIENDAGVFTINGFVIGQYYEEELTLVSAPGLLVRSIIANIQGFTDLVKSTHY